MSSVTSVKKAATTANCSAVIKSPKYPVTSHCNPLSNAVSPAVFVVQAVTAANVAVYVVALGLGDIEALGDTEGLLLGLTLGLLLGLTLALTLGLMLGLSLSAIYFLLTKGRCFTTPPYNLFFTKLLELFIVQVKVYLFLVTY
jgi:hypothetical protein